MKSENIFNQKLNKKVLFLNISAFFYVQVSR